MTTVGLPAVARLPLSPTPLGPIARHLTPTPAGPRTFQRRRLASLAALLAVVLAVAPFVDGPDPGRSVRTAAASGGDQRVSIQSMGSPTAVRDLLSETTSPLVSAAGGTSSSVPSTSAPDQPDAADVEGETTGDPTTTTAPTTSTTQARSTSTTEAPRSSSTSAAPATTAAPTTTTTPPTTSPPTTAAPTTTTAPPREASTSDDGGYAYDDPRSTQVWYDLAACESGGNWSIDSGNGYYGGLQFSLATWESVGGTGYPHEHPAATQIDLGRRLQARQGWGAWPHCSEKLGLH